MFRLRSLWLLFCQVVTVLLAVLWVTRTYWPNYSDPAFPPPPEPILVTAVQAAAPSVVTILSRQEKRGEHEDSIGSNWNSLPERNLHAKGSGVILSEDGKILTNYHVISPLSEIIVRLPNGEDHIAQIVGSDPETDLSVIQIDAQNLPVIRMGSSSQLKVGEPVLAIGNPFSLGQTVTAGIVSALGRHGLGLSDYEDFIQTDAAINRGNSGGPLVNLRGEMVGLNTAIFSPKQGSNFVAIGFAIPTSIINYVLPHLLKGEPVVRGYIGLVTRQLSDEFARDLGLSVTRGVMISQVIAQSPAAKAGLRTFDVVRAINGQAVNNLNEMTREISILEPGTVVTVEVLRGARTITYTLTADERPPEPINTKLPPYSSLE